MPFTLNVSFLWAVPAIIAVSYKIPLPKMLEKWRTSRVLNHLAVQIFKNSKDIPSEAMNFASKSLLVVRELFSHDHFKNSSSARKLTEVVLANFLSCSQVKKKRKFGDIVKAIIEKGTFRKNEINHNLLPSLVKDELNCCSPMAHAIEKNCIDLNDLSDVMIRKLWSNVMDHKNADLANLFIQKGFNLDLANNDGQTLLLEAIAQNNLSQVCFLLKYGAKLPLGNDIVCVKSDSAEQSMDRMYSLGDFLIDKPSIRRVLEQGNLPVKFPFKLDPENPSSFVFWKPAVRIGGWSNAFQVNGSTIYGRTLSVGVISLIALATLTVTTSSQLVPLAFTLTVIPTMMYLNKYERARATWAINNLAIAEFGNLFPFSGVIKYIASNPTLLQEVINEFPTAPFKFDGQGKTLWDYICKYNDLKYDDATALFIFKTLTDILFNDNTVNPLCIQEKKNHFIRAIKSGSTDFVEHLLSQNKILAPEFDDVLQFECWQCLVKTEMVPMFVNHGFNIDARSSEGWTPLLWNLSKGNSYSIINALLEAGADVGATIVLKGKELSVLDLVENKNIRQLLKEYLAKPVVVNL
ncbi:MAG: ankyrin repeat domain-containing protein [Parachlamydiaceae bacterium]|nr:ankyrin repeat domain-containing protein [Parachlamydiaceae bacterium]